MSTYIYDQAWQRERERLAGMEAMWDPGTRRHIEALGIAPGWRCLEVGGGGGAIVEWLAERAGPDGSVLATDLDTRYLDAIERPTVEVRRHDILNDALPDERFELVHARLVLEHIPGRADVLARMASLLAPGGWLLVEDFDWEGFAAEPPSSAAKAVTTAVLDAMTELGGHDRHYGRKLPGALAALGLRDVAAEGRVHVSLGPSPGSAFARLSLEQLREVVVARGAVTAEQVDEALALFDDTSRTSVSGTMIAAWGRSAG